MGPPNVQGASRVHVKATVLIQRNRIKLGRLTSVASGPGSQPASSPAEDPQVMTIPAAGPASTLATNATAGMEPLRATNNGLVAN